LLVVAVQPKHLTLQLEIRVAIALLMARLLSVVEAVPVTDGTVPTLQQVEAVAREVVLLRMEVLRHQAQSLLAALQLKQFQKTFPLSMETKVGIQEI
jgi:hypothetical protein